jgi:hypothetical protein
MADARFRRAIGVHEDGGVTWFNREAFERAVTVLELPRPAELIAAAKQSRYRFDDLARRLAEPPPWASTRPVRRSATDKGRAPKPSGRAAATKSARR